MLRTRHKSWFGVATRLTCSSRASTNRPGFGGCSQWPRIDRRNRRCRAGRLRRISSIRSGCHRGFEGDRQAIDRAEAMLDAGEHQITNVLAADTACGGEKATRIRSPLWLPTAKPSEHPRRLRSSPAMRPPCRVMQRRMSSPHRDAFATLWGRKVSPQHRSNIPICAAC
jgi:hypothetical protein